MKVIMHDKSIILQAEDDGLERMFLQQFDTFGSKIHKSWTGWKKIKTTLKWCAKTKTLEIRCEEMKD